MEDKSKSPTNSRIGSQHWFNTLLGGILHMGEYIFDANDGNTKGYGEQIMKDAKHLIDNYTSIPNEPEEKIVRKTFTENKFIDFLQYLRPGVKITYVSCTPNEFTIEVNHQDFNEAVVARRNFIFRKAEP